MQEIPATSRKCMIVSNGVIAHMMQLELGEEWRVVTPGTGFIGSHFHVFVYVNGWDKMWDESELRLEEWQEWLMSRSSIKHPIVVGL